MKREMVLENIKAIGEEADFSRQTFRGCQSTDEIRERVCQLPFR